MGIDILVHKSLFNHTLAVIENALHFVGRDILSQGRELKLLKFRDKSTGIKNVHIDIGDAKEAIRYGRTGVATCGSKHIDGLSSEICEVAHDTRQETRTYVLKRQRRSMEQLKRLNVVGHFDNRHREVECILNHCLELVLRNVGAEEMLENLKANLCHTLAWHPIPKRIREDGY